MRIQGDRELLARTLFGRQCCRHDSTQGLDKSSGQSRKGADVRDAEYDKAMAEALKPLLNETPKQRATRMRIWAGDVLGVLTSDLGYSARRWAGST
jgi:hypothetical protein